MNPEKISSWTQNFDWILFVGVAAWTLAGMAAFKTGRPRFDLPRSPTWLWGSAFCAVAAAGMLVLLFRYYRWMPTGVFFGLGVLLPVAAFIILAWIFRVIGFGRLRLLLCGGIYLAIWVSAEAMDMHVAASGSPGATRQIFPLSPHGALMPACAALSVFAVAVCLWTHGQYLASLPIASENRAAQRRKAWLFALILVAISAAGFAATEWRCRIFLADQTERLIWRVRTAALGLDLNAMLRLSGKPADRRMPAFAMVTSQLQKIITANADILGAYLWTVHAGSVVLLAHEALHGTGNYPPGLAPLGSGTGDERAFRQQNPFLSLSIRPPSKTAVLTANQRINDPTDQTNQTPFAWLGLDFDPTLWSLGIADLRLQMIAGTFLALLVTAAGYGWITRIEIERDSEREKLVLVESERQRFARDLHDGLGQTLTGLAWRAKALSNGLAGHPAGEASELAGMLSAAVGEARAIALAHAPPALQAGGLRGGLDWLAENTRKLFGASCRLQMPQELPEFSDAAAHALLQIAREAVHNAVRHGYAQNIAITLTPSGAEWKFEISDDGRGIPPSVSSANSLGLRMISERVRELGGSVKFLPNTPTGVWIRCALPDRRIRKNTA